MLTETDKLFWHVFLKLSRALGGAERWNINVMMYWLLSLLLYCTVQRLGPTGDSHRWHKYSTASRRMFTNMEPEPDLFGMNTDLFTEPLVCDSSVDRCVQAIMAGVHSRLKWTSLIYNSNLRVSLLRNFVTEEKQSRGIFPGNVSQSVRQFGRDQDNSLYTQMEDAATSTLNIYSGSCELSTFRAWCSGV